MRNLQLASAAIIAFGTSSLIQIKLLDPQYLARTQQQLPPEVLESPGPQVLQAAALEHAHGVADLQWLDVVQQIGAAGNDSRSVAWDLIRAGCERATDLDPRYESTYEACGIVLVHFGRRLAAAEAILEKGRKNLPNAWNPPFLLGYIAFFERGDPGRAADYVAEAALKPGAARFLAAFAGRLRATAGDPEGAVAMLERLIPELEGPAKEDAEFRLKAIRSEPRLQRFDAACRNYRLAKGVAPKTGAELKEAGFIDEDPVDELGQAIVFGGEDGCEALTELIRVRKLVRKVPASPAAGSQ